MASAVEGEDDTDYVSDPEEANPSLAMRRREASDDEEGHSEEEKRLKRADLRAVIDSDIESDGQGGAADYDDEEFDTGDEEYYEEIEALEQEEEKRYVEREIRDDAEIEVVSMRKNEEGPQREIVGEALAEVEGETDDTGLGDVNQVEGMEKKQNEPFSVPTAGAFYMHDDRFRDNVSGRHRPAFYGRKLWESKDVRKWGHDKFEELSIHERHHEEGRRRGSSRGLYQSRGRNAAPGRGYARGGRSRAYNNGNNQNQVPKSVRGRGPRRYEPSTRNKNEAPLSQHKQSGRPLEKASHKSSGRVLTPSNTESDPVPQQKNMVASSLSSASPPFYPSGASSNSDAPALNRDLQPGNTKKNLGSSVMGGGLSLQQSNAFLRGKNIAGHVGTQKLNIDDHNPPPAGSGLGFSGPMHFQPVAPQNQASRSSPISQLNNVQRSVDQSRTQSSDQTMGQRTSNRSQVFSPPCAALSINSFESRDKESAPESSKSHTMIVGKGSIQGNGRAPFLYNGAQVMGVPGNMGVGHGDQTFPGAPTFLPVMQFGGQHPGGMGVPAVGMAFPGYVGQSQGIRNSEMTWLPVLAGAAGALGGTYSPYMALDSAYHARSLEPTSSSGSSSKENTDKVSNEAKPSQKTELAGDEFGQRQNKPRRYSEMNFGQ